MNTRALVRSALPLLAAALGFTLGDLHAWRERGAFFQATAALPPAELHRLELAPLLAAGNLTWSYGKWQTAKTFTNFELGRLADEDGALKAARFLRFGLLDVNPDGQAAVFAAACAADASVCEHLRERASREARLRVVPPGNALPLSLIGGHPPIPPAAP